MVRKVDDRPYISPYIALQNIHLVGLERQPFGFHREGSYET